MRRKAREQNRTMRQNLLMIPRQLGPQSPRWPLVTHYVVVDWNHVEFARFSYSRRHMYRPIWSSQISTWMIQRSFGRKCRGRMKLELSILVSNRLSMLGGKMTWTPRTSPQRLSMVMETCFRAVSLLRWQNGYTGLRERWRISQKSWMKTSLPQPGYRRWVMDRYSSMAMTQSIQLRQQRSGSRRTTLCGLVSLQTLIL